MAETARFQSAKLVLYRPAPRWHVWAALGGAVLIHLTAVAVAQRREPPPMDLSQIPVASVEATLEPTQEPTPPPEEIVAPTPPPEPEEVQPEFHEETTPPPRVQHPVKVAPIKAPTQGRVGPMSISSAKALATYAPRPAYPYEARSRRVTGSGVCVVTVDTGSGSVTDATMAQSIGSSILDNAAVSAFKNWRFKPGTVSKVRIPITFTLTGASY
ncbi:MAG: energy transducer TonB [Chthoniobacterales bacterium]